jgi:hypothetical protein
MPDSEAGRLRARIAALAREKASQLSGAALGEQRALSQLASVVRETRTLEANVGALLQLTVLVREAEESLADAAQSASSDARLAPLAAAADALRAAGAQSVEEPPRLRAAAHARLRACSVSLCSRLRSELRDSLASDGWPPPLPPASAAAACAWRPSARTLQLCSLLDSAHPVLEGSDSFSCSVAELCSELRERLRAHFCGGLATDRGDKPEWLLHFTLRCASFYAPAAHRLPRPPAAAPPAAALACLLSEEACAVLRLRQLPHLAQTADHASAAWLHMADEARRFDAHLSALAGEARARRCGALRLLCECPAWQRPWHEAELRAALRLLDAAEEAPGAWEAPGGAGEGEDGDAPARGLRPACATAALSLLQQCAARAAQLPAAAAASFYQAVPCALAQDALGRLQRRARGATAFGEPWAAESLRRLAQCVGAARQLEEGLERLGEAPEATEAHAAGSEHRGGVFASELRLGLERQAEWLEVIAQALCQRFQAAAASRLRAARAGHARALAPEVHSLGHSLAALREMLEPALFARVWREVAAAVTAFVVDELSDLRIDQSAAQAVAQECVKEAAAFWMSGV